MVEVQGSPIKKFLIKQFLPLGFVVAVTWALITDVPGEHLYHIMSKHGWKVIPTINICIIFFIFGLTLETSELKGALKNVKVWVVGVLTILVLTSLTAWLWISMEFEPVEFGVGLAVFACSPTALSSAITLCVQSYGNAAMSLLLTVATNLLGILTTPLFVGFVLGKGGAVNKLDLLIKLLVQILVPLVIGKALREFGPGVLPFAKKYKVPLYLFNNFQIVMIVWQTLSASRHKLFEQRFYDILIAIAGAIGQHFLFLVMNFIISWLLRFPEAERKAFVLSSSQKSLPTAAVVIDAFRNPNWENGLITIPCMVFYIMQLFIDSFIANGWAGKYERADALLAKYADKLAELYKLDDPESASFLSSEMTLQASLTLSRGRGEFTRAVLEVTARMEPGQRGEDGAISTEAAADMDNEAKALLSDKKVTSSQ